MPRRPARSAARASADQRHHLVVGGQPRPGDPGRHHRGIAQHRRARGERGVRSWRPRPRCRRRARRRRPGRRCGSAAPPRGRRRRGTATGRPRRGSSRTTAGRSRRRRGCSRARANPTGVRCAAGIRLRSRPARRRSAGCRRPDRSRRSAGASVLAVGGGLCRVGPDVGGGVLAAGAARAGADAQPRRVLVEHQAHRREHPQRGVGDALVEVADQHRAPRRDDQRRVDRREVLRDAGLQHAEWDGCAQRDPAVALRDPADRRAGDRWPCRAGLRGPLQPFQQRLYIGEFGYAPSISTGFGESLGDRDQRRHHIARVHADAGVAAGQQQGGRIRRRGERRCRRRARRRRRGRRRYRTRTGRGVGPGPAQPGSRCPAGPQRPARPCGRRPDPTVARRRCCGPARGWPTATARPMPLRRRRRACQ